MSGVDVATLAAEWIDQGWSLLEERSGETRDSLTATERQLVEAGMGVGLHVGADLMRGRLEAAEARLAAAWSEGHAAGRDYQGDGWNSDNHDPARDNPYLKTSEEGA